MGVFVSQVKKLLKRREIRTVSILGDVQRRTLHACSTVSIAFTEVQGRSFTEGILPLYYWRAREHLPLSDYCYLSPALFDCLGIKQAITLGTRKPAYSKAPLPLASVN